jgi:hypothetical protein
MEAGLAEIAGPVLGDWEKANEEIETKTIDIAAIYFRAI